jgi:hypothetical protein
MRVVSRQPISAMISRVHALILGRAQTEIAAFST